MSPAALRAVRTVPYCIDMSTTKAKRPSRADVAALEAKAAEALKAWGYGTGTEEQKQAFLKASAAFGAARDARRRSASPPSYPAPDGQFD